jgi:hypothetical protein
LFSHAKQLGWISNHTTSPVTCLVVGFDIDLSALFSNLLLIGLHGRCKPLSQTTLGINTYTVEILR